MSAGAAVVKTFKSSPLSLSTGYSSDVVIPNSRVHGVRKACGQRPQRPLRRKGATVGRNKDSHHHVAKVLSVLLPTDAERTIARGPGPGCEGQRLTDAELGKVDLLRAQEA